jgi:RNase P/RNase MRP subunit p29
VIIPIDSMNLLKIDCGSSDKVVFLKMDNAEEFYVRTGPASVKLDGSKLIAYVDKKFKKEPKRI